MTPRLKHRSASGLRTRYAPRSRIGHGLILAAPWINLLLLILFFLMVDRRLSLQPGYAVNLPLATFTAGSRSDLKVVIRAVTTAGAGHRKEIVYFNDQRFLAADEGQMKRFQETLAGCVRRSQMNGVIVFADAGVDLSTLSRLFEMAREVGVRRVTVASRSALEGPGGASK